MKINTLFVGTSNFSIYTLETLTKLDFINLIGIITQPDKPVGRHQSIYQASPVKKWVLENLGDIQIFQPIKLLDKSSEILDKTKPDLIVVASYAQMIPENMLNYPKYKCLNIHASLLPQLRGATPIQMAILKGLGKTGVSLVIMTKKLDAGDIISQKEINISSDDTALSLERKLGKLSQKILTQDLKFWINGKIKPIKQNEDEATFCYIKDVSKEKAKILPTDDAILIDRKIRAFYPSPVSWSFLKSPKDNKQKDGIEANEKFKGKRFKIFKAKILDDCWVNKKGLKLFKSKRSLILRADVGWLEILEFQLEGKKRMNGSDYLFLPIDRALSVRGILVYKNKVLMMYRKKMGKEYLATPGGSVGVHESFKNALVREFKEETGLDVEIKDLIDINKNKGNKSNFVYIHYVYLVKLKGKFQEPIVNGEEREYDESQNYYKPKWFDIDEALSYDISKIVKKYLLSLKK